MTLKKSGIAAVTLCSLLMTSSPSQANFQDLISPQERCERIVNLLEEGKGNVHYTLGIDDKYCSSKILEEAYNRGIESRFNKKLFLIENGNTQYASWLYEYAQYHNFDKQLIYNAVEIGRPKEFDRILRTIERGTTALYSRGEELVEKYGFSQERLNEAIQRGVVEEYRKLTTLIERGVSNLEPIRERLVDRFDLDEKELLAYIVTPNSE